MLQSILKTIHSVSGLNISYWLLWFVWAVWQGPIIVFCKGVGGGEEDPVASPFIFNGIIFYDCALLLSVIWLLLYIHCMSQSPQCAVCSDCVWYVLMHTGKLCNLEYHFLFQETPSLQLTSRKVCVVFKADYFIHDPDISWDIFEIRLHRLLFCFYVDNCKACKIHIFCSLWLQERMEVIVASFWKSCTVNLNFLVWKAAAQNYMLLAISPGSGQTHPAVVRPQYCPSWSERKEIPVIVCPLGHGGMPV